MRFWPFDRTSTNKLLDKAVAELRAAQSPAHDDAMAKLTKRIDAIEMEWMEWFDKFRRLYARLAKRQEREDRDAEQETSPDDAPQRTNGLADVSRHGGPRAPRRNY